MGSATRQSSWAGPGLTRRFRWPALRPAAEQQGIGLTGHHSALSPRAPVGRRSAVVRESKDAYHVVGRFEIDNVEGKPLHRHTTNSQFGGQVWHRTSGARRASNELQGGGDGVEKLFAHAPPLFFVPEGCFGEFRRSFGFGPKPRSHRFVKRRAIRSRTSSHGSPADSPARTRRARRSISLAQAACTAAGSSTVESSRLANSSAATSARSSTGSVRASRRSVCARLLIESF